MKFKKPNLLCLKLLDIFLLLKDLNNQKSPNP